MKELTSQHLKAVCAASPSPGSIGLASSKRSEPCGVSAKAALFSTLECLQAPDSTTNGSQLRNALDAKVTMLVCLGRAGGASQLGAQCGKAESGVS